MKNNIAFKIYIKKSIEKIDSKVKLLGIYNNLQTLKFLNIRLILTIIIFVLVLVIDRKSVV